MSDFFYLMNHTQKNLFDLGKVGTDFLEYFLYKEQKPFTFKQLCGDCPTFRFFLNETYGDDLNVGLRLWKWSNMGQDSVQVTMDQFFEMTYCESLGDDFYDGYDEQFPLLYSYDPDEQALYKKQHEAYLYLVALLKYAAENKIEPEIILNEPDSEDRWAGQEEYLKTDMSRSGMRPLVRLCDWRKYPYVLTQRGLRKLYKFGGYNSC